MIIRGDRFTRVGDEGGGGTTTCRREIAARRKADIIVIYRIIFNKVLSLCLAIKSLKEYVV